MVLAFLATLNLRADEALAQNAQKALTNILLGPSAIESVVNPSQAETFIQYLGTEISTYPTSTAAAAFAPGIPTPNTSPLTSGTAVLPLENSFGPLLLDRWATTGGTASFAVSFQQNRWRQLDRIHLDHGDLQVVAFGTPQTRAYLDVRSYVATLQALYGIASRLDVGANVPVVRVCVKGDRVSASGSSVSDHQCSNGLGDISATLKLNALRRRFTGAALGIDVIVPTGDDRALLGRGKAQTKAYLTAAHQFSGLEVNGEVAAVLGGKGVSFIGATILGTTLYRISAVEPSSELQAGLSVEWTPSWGPGLTAFGELLERRVSNTASFSISSSGESRNIESNPLSASRRDVFILGTKYLLPGPFVLATAVSLSPTKSGLSSAPGVVVQIERPLRKHGSQ